VTGYGNFAQLTASSIALGTPYHNRPYGGTSEIRSSIQVCREKHTTSRIKKGSLTP
jgi:hypothetical protein